MSIIPSPAGSFPALARPPVDPVLAVEVFLAAHAELPVARPPVSTPGGVVVTVGDVDGLAGWLAACGGTIRRSIPDDGVQTWQLYTSLPPRADGSRTAVRVVTAAAEDVPVADEVLSAVVSGGPRAAARGPLTADQLAEIRARVEADYPTVCTVCGHGRLVHRVPAPHRCLQAPVTENCPCPGWQHPYLPAKGRHGRQDRRDALALLAEVARLAEELASYRALELGAPDGRVSAACPDPEHPTWLRDLDDTRGCPWCRVAEVERQARADQADRHDDLAHALGRDDAAVGWDELISIAASAAQAESESQVRAKALREAAAEVRARCLSVPGRCGCHTAAALLEAMARADGTGLLHCETPARGDTITERGHQMTCAPPALAWARRLDAHGLAAFLLDLASAAGGYFQRDDHAEVLARVEGVLAQHEATLTDDGPDACGHDADDQCEGCGRCPCAVCATDRVCRCECACPPSVPDGYEPVPDGAGESR